MIIWFASYPKSGNTWLRILISNYLFPERNNLFDNLEYIKDYPKTFFFDNLANEQDLKSEKLNFYKYFILSQDKINLNNQVNFLKTHSCCGTINNYKFTNKENTLGFIYLIRDPRSVAVSYAYHSNNSFEKSTEIITDEKNISIGDDKIVTFKSSWKMNYISWIKSPYPRVFIKYEEFVNQPFETFKKVLEFINNFKKIDISENKILDTIKNCDFNKLKLEEKNKGFDEKWGNEFFFRRGLVDEWKKVLSKELIFKIEKEFNTEMKELGYL